MHGSRPVRDHPELGLGGPQPAMDARRPAGDARLYVAPLPRLPVLVLLGAEEEVVAPGVIRHQTAPMPRAELAVFSGARHELWSAPRSGRALGRLRRLSRRASRDDAGSRPTRPAATPVNRYEDSVDVLETSVCFNALVESRVRLRTPTVTGAEDRAIEIPSRALDRHGCAAAAPELGPELANSAGRAGQVPARRGKSDLPKRAMIRPGRGDISSTSSASSTASSTLWVTKTDPAPRRADPQQLDLHQLAGTGVDAGKGSSISRISGSVASARASATRWRMPPDHLGRIGAGEPAEPDKVEIVPAPLCRTARGPLTAGQEADIGLDCLPGGSAEARKTTPIRGPRARQARPRPAPCRHRAGSGRRSAAERGLAAAARTDHAHEPLRDRWRATRPRARAVPSARPGGGTSGDMAKLDHRAALHFRAPVARRSWSGATPSAFNARRRGAKSTIRRGPPCGIPDSIGTVHRGLQRLRLNPPFLAPAAGELPGGISSVPRSGAGRHGVDPGSGCRESRGQDRPHHRSDVVGPGREHHRATLTLLITGTAAK